MKYIAKKSIFRFRILAAFFLTSSLIALPLFSQNAKSIIAQAEKYLWKIDIRTKPTQSAVFIHKALPLYKKAKDWEKYVACQNLLMTAYYYAEEFDSCSMFARSAMDDSNKYLTEKSVQYVAAVANLGFVYDMEGKYQKALELNRKSRELQQKNTADLVNLHLDYTNAASIFFTLGDYDEAIAYHTKAHDTILDTLGANCHEAAYLCREIASCYKSKKQYDTAINYYQKCINILDKLNRKEFYDQTRWFSYVDLADIYFHKDDKDNVLRYIEKAIKIQTQYNLLNDYKTWEVLGKLYKKQGEYNLALKNFNKQKNALDTEYQIYGKHPLKAIAIANIAGVYTSMGDYEMALSHYQTALQTISVGFTDNDMRQNPTTSQFINKSDALDILVGKSAALVASYQHKKSSIEKLKAANDCNHILAELVNSIRQGYLAEGSKHTLSEKAVPIYDNAIEVALELHRVTGNIQYLEQAFAFAESNKAVLLFEHIRDQMAKGFVGIPDSLMEKERDLQADISFYEKKILENKQKLTPSNAEKTKNWESKVFELKEQRNKLNKYLETQYPQYFALKYQTGPASIADIRKKLPDNNTALIEYMLGPQNGYAFFLTKKELSVFKIQYKDALAGQLVRLREIIATPPASNSFADDFADFSSSASALYASLLKNGLEKLPSSISRLVIIPDDMLNYLPFEVLLLQPVAAGSASFSPKKLSYLFEDYAISYHYSATLLANSVQKQRKTKDKIPFLGFAPRFGEGIASTNRACSSGQLSSLACNVQEVEAIQALLGGRAVLSDAAATKAFLLDAPGSSILHLATHACIDESSPGLNRIFFADGYLDQLDLDQLRLQNELTVLSACNTGTGKLLTGEGVMSMARSFLLAGSASVLTSLWAVDDCATSNVMLQYYRSLKKGLPKDVALQNAKTIYLSEADAENAHPYYWAAFVQFGDVSPLEGTGWTKWAIFAGAGLTAVGLLMLWQRRKVRKSTSSMD